MSNPLATMHPLIYPEPPTDSAWMWWIGIGLLLFVSVFVTWLLFKRKQLAAKQSQNSSVLTEQFRQQAMLELEQLNKPLPTESASPWLQHINHLLKRLCSVRYPDSQCHRLSGREWLAFLDSRCPAAGLTHWMILAEGSYLPNCYMEQSAIDGLHTAVQTWILKHA